MVVQVVVVNYCLCPCCIRKYSIELYNSIPHSSMFSPPYTLHPLQMYIQHGVPSCYLLFPTIVQKALIAGTEILLTSKSARTGQYDAIVQMMKEIHLQPRQRLVHQHSVLFGHFYSPTDQHPSNVERKDNRRYASFAMGI